MIQNVPSDFPRKLESLSANVAALRMRIVLFVNPKCMFCKTDIVSEHFAALRTLEWSTHSVIDLEMSQQFFLLVEGPATNGTFPFFGLRGLLGFIFLL
jgi:hypothetical protein